MMGDMRFVDMHVHSRASDGTRTPDEIVSLAVEKGIGMLSVADHDTIASQERMVRLCEGRDIRYIPGVELDALDGDDHYHILAYDFDIYDAGFREWMSHCRYALDEMSVRLIEKMAYDYENISFASYTDFPDMAGCGGWKALHYLVSRGVSRTLRDGFKFYPQYGIVYSKAGFPTVRTVCDRVNRAGGYAVLAHPGEMIDTACVGRFKDALRGLLTKGIQGIECYYPHHTDEITEACLAVCGEKSLYITSGSDDHGSFGKEEIGQMMADCDMVWVR